VLVTGRQLGPPRVPMRGRPTAPCELVSLDSNAGTAPTSSRRQRV
jgi:hypothetical protein